MIVLMTQCFPPRIGGIEALIKGLADALSAMGHDIAVLADSHGESDEADFDHGLAYPVHRFGWIRPWRRHLKARALKRLLDRGDVAAVFTDSWKSAESTAGLVTGRGLPLICLAHGNDVLVHKASRQRRVAKTLSSVTRVAANSTFTADAIVRLGVAADLITVVNPGAVPPARPDLNVVERMADRLGKGGPVLVTIARIEPRKGHDQVLRSLPALETVFPDLIYAIAGDGPDRARLERLSQELGVGHRTCFLGPVSDENKAALLELADLFVMPARHDQSGRSVEGFGIAYLEAAFSGVPAIAGRAGGGGDAVADGTTGVLCDGDETDAVERAIRHCLANPARLQEMGKAARTRAEREFTWTTAAGRYLACAGLMANDSG